MQRTKKLEEKEIKTREQNKGRKIKTLLSSPIHLAHHRSTVAPLSLRYCSAVAPILLRCRSVVAPLPQRYFTATVPLSLRRCCSVVALLSLLLLLRSRTAIAPLLRHCRSAAVAPAVATQSTGIKPLSRRCRTAIAPAQRGYK